MHHGTAQDHWALAAPVNTNSRAAMAASFELRDALTFDSQFFLKFTLTISNISVSPQSRGVLRARSRPFGRYHARRSDVANTDAALRDWGSQALITTLPGHEKAFRGGPLA
ncbi:MULTISPECIES: hypothetical protein [Aquabacterium]|uniref:hypothetical protein n=1 Tax=Aquabacterium TaxID=92793 RepID=UPI00105EF356|nr:MULTISPECIES: hypothetical protein [Aquabacterium]MDI1348844.1 hypothetical protein [Aquabacterium sp.]